MSAFAYLLPPVTGVIVYFAARDPRPRFHALQSVLLGVLWPLLLYAATLGGPRLTQATALAGAAVWLALLVSAALGKSPRLPVAGTRLEVAARAAPSATDEV